MKQDETTALSDVTGWNLGHPQYALTTRVPNGEFSAVVERVKEELSKVGFGVLTEIDLQATLKKKLDANVPRYVILGACNPALAYRAVQAEPGIGALLPCNVMVAQEADAIVVAAIDPQAMFGVVGRPDVEPLAVEVRKKLQQALDALDATS